MASTTSPAQDASLPPPQQQPSPAPPSSRRLPPPCWSHDETVALIDSYRDKWYALRRGNLRANHWQEVADAVSRRCPLSSPPKTSVQCRHKMEKLRKRYRTELQRSMNAPSHRFNSSWVHFKRMDAMEKGPSSTAAVESGSDGDDDDDDDDQDLYEDGGLKRGIGNTRSLQGLMSNGIGSGGGPGAGFRIRIPGRGNLDSPPMAKIYGNFDQNPNPSPNFGSRVLGDNDRARPAMGKRSGGGGGDPVAEMQKKMDMAREVEAMRMDMEMKRTEMILESQQRIVEAFANALSEKKKKPKKMTSSPEY
ncbi:hypothetical protein AAG906_021834 [Vitis piasezkii]